KIYILETGHVPGPDRHTIHRIIGWLGALISQILRIFRSCFPERIPPFHVRSCDLGIIDENAIVRLGAEAGDGPVCASRPYLLWFATLVTKNNELVVREVRALHQPVKHLNFRVPLQILPFFLVLIGYGWRSFFLVGSLIGARSKNQTALRT